MKWMCITAGGLTLLPVLFFVSTGNPRLFQPGPLSKVHQLPGVGCHSCHRPWSLTESGTTGCVSANCHFALRQQEIHLKDPQPPCSQCHAEHARVSMQPATVVGDGPCRDCHLPKLDRNHPRKPACHKCHFHHVAPHGYAPSAARPTAIPMKHAVHLATMTEILNTQDFEGLCRICHVVRPGLYSFAPFTRQGCNQGNPNCHSLKKPEGAKKWRDPLAQKPVPDWGKNPAQTRAPNALFLHSTHVQKHKCLDCHNDILNSRRVLHTRANAAFCVRCHQSSDAP